MGRSPRAKPQPVVSVLQRNCADRVDPASGRTSGADSWFAGPKADPVAGLAASELVEVGLVSLAEIFGLSPDRVRGDLVASLAIDWGNCTFAARRLFPRNAQNTRSAVGARETGWRRYYFFSGEALYAGPDMGTVEAALASGRATAQTILGAGP